MTTWTPLDPILDLSIGNAVVIKAGYRSPAPPRGGDAHLVVTVIFFICVGLIAHLRKRECFMIKCSKK
ncbi:hypothetical protein DPMN_131004 [Dreissena polymorpha]|uniref:Uncharacterized protein n=1 Tax=Dreissena polymorpha TaxID=45954 RepID=A0A9D4H8P7_DREPO|nr:hypothetical protein DPMN_131004 [Dreissena polymorpha]